LVAPLHIGMSSAAAAPILGAPMVRSPATNRQRRSPLGVRPLPHKSPHMPAVQVTLARSRAFGGCAAPGCSLRDLLQCNVAEI
jgi:hypothetical protein